MSGIFLFKKWVHGVTVASNRCLIEVLHLCVFFFFKYRQVRIQVVYPIGTEKPRHLLEADSSVWTEGSFGLVWSFFAKPL